MITQSGRVVMIGDSSVGKSSIISRLCDNEWSEDLPPTVSAACYTLNGDPAKKQDSLQIWDTAGAESYRAVNSVYYHNATGGILVFDLASRQSFESLDSWIEEFRGLAEAEAVVAVVGNKLDLYANGGGQVTPEEGAHWAKAHELVYWSTSAETGAGIDGLRNYILDNVPGRTPQYAVVEPRSPDGNKKCC